MTNLVAGYGEIGKAVGAVIGKHSWIDLGGKIAEGKFDVLHICFPYTGSFVSAVNNYIEWHEPEHVVIYSTVPIGTTEKFFGVVHSPIEGKHPDLELSIRHMERWIGYNVRNEGQWFANYFNDLGLRVRMVENSNYTEALKLLSTTEYGINIEFARYKKWVADELGMDYELTKEWNREYNALYKNLGLEKWYQKYVLDAPVGAKQGHCVTPNAVLLNEQFPNKMVEIVGEI